MEWINESLHWNMSDRNDSKLPPGNTDFESIRLGMIPAYSVIFILALIGNILIIYIVVSKPYMKSTTNYLIANMSVADLLMTLFTMPYSIAYLYIQSLWFGGVLGHLCCKLFHFAVGLSIAASVITLMVISMDRFFAIVYPFRRASVIKRISITNTAIWVTSAILLSPYFYMYQVQKHADGTFHCIVSFGRLVDTFAVMRIYNTVTFVCLYFTPLLVIGIFYTAICRKLWLRKIPGNPSVSNRRTADRYKRRTIKMLIVIVIVFAACWLPAHLMHYYIYYQYDTFTRFPPYIAIIAFWISHANSAINPFLYITLNRNFMHAFKDIAKAMTSCTSGNRRDFVRSVTVNSWTNLSIMTREKTHAVLKPEDLEGRNCIYELDKVVQTSSDDENTKAVSLVGMTRSLDI